MLADTERLHLRAYQEVLAEEGVRMSEEEYYSRYLGLDDHDVLRAIARDCGLPPGDAEVRSLLERKARRYAELIATAPLLFDGVAALVHDWSRHVPLAIASGALRHEIEGVLARAQVLPCFAAIVSAEDVARGKPAPDPYLAALEALRSSSTFGRSDVPRPGHAPAVLPARCVVIEDSLPGIASARAAGVHVVAVSTNHPPERLAGADLVVPSVAALDLRTLDGLVKG